MGRFLFRVVSDFLGIPSVTKSAREQPLKGGVESGGCRRTLITSRYVSLVSRPWNKKIHPLYKCMTNGWKLARSLLGRNEETLPAILSSYFPSIFPVCPIYPSFYTELFLSQRGISFDQIRTNRIPWNNLTSITQGRKEFNFCSDIFFRFFLCWK